jgi:hypothetical protein
MTYDFKKSKTSVLRRDSVPTGAKYQRKKRKKSEIIG